MIDLLFLTHNRLEFTRASLTALLANTDWSLVRCLYLYDDNSTDGTREYVESALSPVECVFRAGKWGGPVAVMNEFIQAAKPDLFAKIDSDTMVPPRWLNECARVMQENPHISLLGIEPHHAVQATAVRRYCEPCTHIGGIGLMRGEAFRYGLPRPDGRMGFTAWQAHESAVGKAWLNPALPVFLLDRMPTEPWARLSLEYEAKKWQRPWAKYTPDQRALWEWSGC